jgi:hypothetical protein
MHYSSEKPKIQPSGQFKSLCFKERKMNKIMTLIIVAGLVLLSLVHAKTAICDSLLRENTQMAVSPDVSIAVPSDCTSVCVVYVETNDLARPEPVSASALANITTQLPDIPTIMMLGLGGLIYRRRKE